MGLKLTFKRWKECVAHRLGRLCARSHLLVRRRCPAVCTTALQTACVV